MATVPQLPAVPLEAAPAAERRRRRALALAWPPLAYATLALAFWGPWVLDHPRATILGANDVDPSVYLWFFAWWPHALSDGLNPFFTNLIFVPEGFNLAWTVSMPGPSLLLAPITLTLGDVATWNAVMFAAPVLAAWSAYALCRRVCGAALPAFVGGYVFGFSPYVLSQMQGAPQLALVGLVPLLVLLVARHVEGSLSDRRLVVGVAALVGAQLLVSTEVLATTAFFGAVTLALAWWRLPERRAALRRTAGRLALGAAAAAVVVSPMLYYLLFGHRTLPEHALEAFPADLLSLVVPGSLVAASVERVGGSVPGWATDGAYLGVPLLALVGVFAWRQGRNRAAQVLLGAFATAAVFGLGRTLIVGGHDTNLPMPWTPFGELPFLRYAIPLRFTVYASLAAALIVALALARRPGAGTWALAALVVLSIVPAVGSSAWHTPFSDPPFFASGRAQEVLGARDHVLTIPAWGRNMRWQSRADFSYAMATGYTGAFPASYSRFPIYNRILGAGLIPGVARDTPKSRAQLRRFVAAKGVTAIVVQDGFAPEWAPLLGTLGARPVREDGVVVYRLRGAPPG
jgi:hypothetical protein